MRHTDVTHNYADVRDFGIRLEQAHPDLTQHERAHLASRRYLPLVGLAGARARLVATAPGSEPTCVEMDPEDLLRRMVLEIAVIFGYDPADPARSVEAAALLSGVGREAESARRGATDLVSRFIGATVEGAAYGLMTWEIAREAIRFYGLTSQTSRPVHARANPRLVARPADGDSASGPE